jgi:intraflagellar transport protein 172
VISIAWSPNNLKLAVASSDRSIYLFDENGIKRDRFSTKPIDPKVFAIWKKLIKILQN